MAQSKKICFSILAFLFSLFTYSQIGNLCNTPIVIPSLPYEHIDNTANYGDEVDTNQGAFSLCGAVPIATNYLAGNEVYYSYLATQTGPVSVTLKPQTTSSTSSSVFVYTGCDTSSGCIAGMANSSASIRYFVVNMTAGQNYIIVISSSASNQSIAYDLVIQQENCPRPMNISANSNTPYTAQLSWDNPDAYSSWQVAVQPIGSLIPTGNGEPTTSNTFLQTDLNPGTKYQVWVRGECTAGSGIFSAWTGPYPFNTQICEGSQTCGYTFRLTDTGNNGWGTNRMQVRQNGILVATLGNQLPVGFGPVDVTVPLCTNVPFDVFWSNTGVSPGQCGLSIINPFQQTIYSKPANLNAVGTVLYTGMTNCILAECTIVPTNVVTQNIGFTEATINWAAPSTDSWDIYVVPSNEPDPTAATQPTYNNVSTNPFTVTNLLADTDYKIYVRVNCTPEPSAWSVVTFFTTLTSCYRPLALDVPAVSATSASLNWQNGPGAGSSVEILLIPGPTPPAPPTLNPTISNGAFLFNASSSSPYNIASGTLTPATIYYYYIRSICSANEKSNWAGPYVFNTITCEESQKCFYKFVLLDTVSNTWNGARMQVKQNGILISTLGASSINNQNGVTIALCNNIPFELYWSVAGVSPETIGIKVISPFSDIIYQKAAGDGAPLTNLYTGSGQCSTPSCNKPLNPIASQITASSAKLSWTYSMTSPSEGFDLYVVSAGSPDPDTYFVPSSMIPNVGNNYVLTNINGQPLQPSKAYTFYVRSICSASTKSTWTILTPVTFITAPLNDSCANALTVTVNPDQNLNPANMVPGSTLGATASTVNNASWTCLPTGVDIWFKFTATSIGHVISFTNITNTPPSVQINYTVFSGNCGNLTELICGNVPNRLIPGLIPGDTYYVRISPSTYNASNILNFNIGITSPPQNDECNNAVNVPVNADLIASQSVVGNTLGATGSLPAGIGVGCASTDDDVWFNFIATSPTHIVTVNSLNQNVILNYSVFSGECGALTNLFCSNMKSRVAQNLTVGQAYKIRVYTSASTIGASANFTVSVTTPLPVINDECATAIPVATNTNSFCDQVVSGSLTGATATPGQTSTCQPGADDDVWFSFVATSTTHVISFLNVVGESTNINHSVLSGQCGALVVKYCSPANTFSTMNSTYQVGQTYYIRVWSAGTNTIAVNFTLCIKSVSSCTNAEPFCGSSPDDPFIFSNTTGIPDATQVACLGSIPNPTYYTLQVEQTGNLQFNIQQFESFDIMGQPVGAGLDVDYVAWGPFASAEACNLIAFSDCPTCPNNTLNASFYPFGNIVDCSYSTNEIETLSIPNAIAGEYYVVLITNFEDDPGYIKLVQSNFGQPDAGTTLCTDKIQLIAFLDENSNGIKDGNEINYPHGRFTYQKNNAGVVHKIASPIGKHTLYDAVPANTYDFGYEVYPEFASYYSASATAFNDLSIAAGSGSTNLYFPIVVSQPYTDVAISIVPVSQPVAGMTYKNKIVCTNLGTTTVPTTVYFTTDPNVTILDSDAVYSYESSNLYSFPVTLYPFESKSYLFNMSIQPIPIVSISDVLTNSASIVPPAADTVVSNNSTSNSQIVVASFDPNDKIEARGEKITITDFGQQDYLQYTIRFQNTGNYKATDIRIEDVLDAQLDKESVRTLSASHNYSMEVLDNKVIWSFPNINLPAITQNEPLSHGYVTFKVKLNPGFAVGDVIPNNASIYFDSNPAIITNTFQTTFEAQLSTPELKNGNIVIYPNPANYQIEIITQNTSEVLESIILYDISGKIIKQSGKLSSVSTSLNVSDLAKGMYLIEVTTQAKHKLIKKLVIN